MSTGELIAWQAGVDWVRAGFTLADLDTVEGDELLERLSPEAWAALLALSVPTFGYWMRKGIADAHQAGKL